MTMGFALFVIDIVLQCASANASAATLAGRHARMGAADPAAGLQFRLAALGRPRADTLDAGRWARTGRRARLSRLRAQWLDGDACRRHDDRAAGTGGHPAEPVVPAALDRAGHRRLRSVASLPVLSVLAGAAGSRAGARAAWTRTTGQREDRGPIDIGRGEAAPTHYEISGAPSWWGMVFTLFANGTLFASLLFGALFLWAVAPNWPPPSTGEVGLVLPCR
jgi:cytochrome c oxidase subunit I+III